jgi:hypothetical protein
VVHSPTDTEGEPAPQVSILLPWRNSATSSWTTTSPPTTQRPSSTT